MEAQKVDVAWNTTVLVCHACFARKDGPACGGSSGMVRARIKGALQDLKPGVRALETSCLDLCPAGAYAVAIASSSRPPEGYALTTLEQADEIVRRVRERTC